MNEIKIRRHVDSETIRIPELRSMMGKDVEITVIEDSGLPPGDLVEALNAFDHLPVDMKALEELREDSMI